MTNCVMMRALCHGATTAAQDIQLLTPFEGSQQLQFNYLFSRKKNTASWPLKNIVQYSAT